MDIPPTQCPMCCCEYTMCSHHAYTMVCGHTVCESCAINLARCPICAASPRPEGQIEFLSMVCAGCRRHYTEHHDTRINQVRILSCGHRQFCGHQRPPFTCLLCNYRQTRKPTVDVSATALVCGTRITDRNVRVPPRSVRRRWCCWRRRRESVPIPNTI